MPGDLSARHLRQVSDGAYERGYVLGIDGTRVDLHPHALAPADAGGLRELAVAEGAGATLEVGLGLGLGTLTLCEALLAAGRPDARHLVIEPWPDDFAGAGLRTLRDAGLEGLVEVRAAESALALPELVKEGRRFDLALIDGDHRFEAVLMDLCFAERLVRPGGLVVLDDVWMPGIRLAVSYVERNLGWRLLPEAMPAAFRWRRLRNLPGRRLRGKGSMAVLRLPAERPDRRDWDDFAAFG